MSNLLADPRFDPLVSREAEIAPGMIVRRSLPARARRTIGAWCFLDSYGPAALEGDIAMRVSQHPHIGLQTVTWLFQGSVLHRDSLGSVQQIEPGQLNLMTSGRGIAHAEFTPEDAPHQLHGIQLWVALPDVSRNVDPSFEHHAELPRVSIGPVEALVFMGTFANEKSAARAFSPIAGAELRFAEDGIVTLPLDPTFEYGLQLVDGSASSEATQMTPDTLYHLGTGRTSIVVKGKAGTVLLLLGGTPFNEQIVMWWNFVARSSDEIEAARNDWEGAAERFGPVANGGQRISAPPYLIKVKPR